MVAQLGMSERLGPVEYLRSYEKLSSETRAMVESEVKRVLEDSYARARTLLIAKRRELDLLAQALVQYETLDKSEVEKVLRGEKLVGRIAAPPGPMAVPKPDGPAGVAGVPVPPVPPFTPGGPGVGGAGSGAGEDAGSGGSTSPPPPAPPPPSANPKE